MVNGAAHEVGFTISEALSLAGARAAETVYINWSPFRHSPSADKQIIPLVNCCLMSGFNLVLGRLYLTSYCWSIR